MLHHESARGPAYGRGGRLVGCRQRGAVITVVDPDAARRSLVAGELACPQPDCGGRRWSDVVSCQLASAAPAGSLSISPIILSRLARTSVFIWATRACPCALASSMSCLLYT